MEADIFCCDVDVGYGEEILGPGGSDESEVHGVK
jgi:hypothetical protein